MAGEVNAVRAALFAGLACTVPAVIWGVGLAASPHGAVAEGFAAGVAGLWIAQALCLAVLLPACVTLWTAREAASGAALFVLVPLPVLTLAWLMGVLPAAVSLRGLLLLGAGAVLVLAAMGCLRVSARPTLAGAAMMVLLQTGLGSVTLVFRDSWLDWVGL